MYKIIILCPDHELQKLDDELDALSDFEVESATTLIINAGEDDNSIRLLIGLCKMIADGELRSLTVTKEDDAQTEV